MDVIKWMRFALVLVFSIVSSSQISAKKIVLDSFVQHRINKLARLADSLTYSRNQSTRLKVSAELMDSLEEISYLPNSFYYNYDSFRTVAVVASKDDKVRVFTWNYFNDSGFYKVNGVMQLNGKDFDQVFYSLKPIASSFDTLRKTLSPENWLPALYYDIYTYKYKRKCYYILTGFNAGNPILRYNTVECLVLEKGKDPQFGSPIFYEQEQMRIPHQRLFFLYSGQATMICQVEPKQKMIVYSSLVPVRYKREGNRAYYTPDGTYDYYEYKKGNWYKKGLLEEFKGIGNSELTGPYKTE